MVAPTFRLTREQQDQILEDATLMRYGDGELVQRSGEVPDAMRFIVSGSIQLTATAEDGSEVVAATIDEGSYLGQTTLTRQTVIGSGYAVDELTVVYIARDQIEEVVHGDPLLLQELGRSIEAAARLLIRALASTDSDDDVDS